MDKQKSFQTVFWCVVLSVAVGAGCLLLPRVIRSEIRRYHEEALANSPDVMLQKLETAVAAMKTSIPQMELQIAELKTKQRLRALTK
jgi:uncharacterized membrane protein